MHKKISRQVSTVISLSLVCLLGCAKRPQSVSAGVHLTSNGYHLKMADFSLIFPSDWGGSIAPGINQTRGHLARQEAYAFNSRLDIKIRYYSEKYGWSSYKQWFDGYKSIFENENCSINYSKINKYNYVIFICNRLNKLSFTILVDCHGSTLVVNGTAKSKRDISQLIKILNSLEIRQADQA